MEKIYYFCDGGCVAVLTKSGDLIKFPNGWGDDSNRIYVMNQQEFDEYEKSHQEYESYTKNIRYQTTCTFNDATILSYDCVHDLEDVQEYNSKVKLNGTYSIYNCIGKVYFIKLNEDHFVYE